MRKCTGRMFKTPDPNPQGDDPTTQWVKCGRCGLRVGYRMGDEPDRCPVLEGPTYRRRFARKYLQRESQLDIC